MTAINHQFRLKRRPNGEPQPTDFEYAEEPVREPAEGEVLVRSILISLDPAMRGWMNDVRSYVPPIALGETIRALGAGRVVASKHDKFAEGDYVTGMTGIQEYVVSDPKTLNLIKVDPTRLPLERYLSALGMTGMTAYFGLLDVGKPEPGETVVVSGAAGAVGSLVGQIAKIKGCRVVGIAGGPDKCAHVVNDLGFDACVDYKNQDVKKGLKEHCPKGIDVYFDNVGGEILDAALTRLATRARVVICGAISQYNAERTSGPNNYLTLLITRSRMEGFVVFDYGKQFREAATQMAEWMIEGKLKSREDIVEGLETFPQTFLKLFSGGNTGKLLLRVADERA